MQLNHLDKELNDNPSALSLDLFRAGSKIEEAFERQGIYTLLENFFQFL